MNHRSTENFVFNSAFSNRHMDEQMRIVREYIGDIISKPEVIVCTDNELDRARCADVRIKTGGGDVSLRVRRNIGYRDLTIRYSVPSGHATEIDKLRKGHGDWFFYFWTNDKDEIADWWIIDITQMRRQGMLESNWPLRTNNDGSRFIVIDYDALQEAGCILKTHTQEMIAKHRGKQCEWGSHAWIEVDGKHGRKVECSKCGKFYGYLRRD